jgi:hypothetical protein
MLAAPEPALRDSVAPLASPRLVAPPKPARLTYGICDFHAGVDATAKCAACGATVCDVCTFVMPDRAKMCPECATSPAKVMTPGRWLTTILAYGLGLLSFLLLIIIAAGLTPEGFANVMDPFGLLYISLTGLLFSGLSVNSRIGNNLLIWGALVLNALFMAAFIGLYSINMLFGSGG